MPAEMLLGYNGKYRGFGADSVRNSRFSQISVTLANITFRKHPFDSSRVIMPCETSAQTSTCASRHIGTTW